MAKSLRSKQMRKNRAVKRIRYGEKELKRLNDMVDRTKVREEEEAKAAREARALADAEMKDEQTGKDSKVINNNKGKNNKDNKATNKGKNKPEDSGNEEEEEADDMEVDKKPRNKKTLQDEHGQYPAWMGGRRLKAQKKVVKRLKGKKK